MRANNSYLLLSIQRWLARYAASSNRIAVIAVVVVIAIFLPFAACLLPHPSFCRLLPFNFCLLLYACIFFTCIVWHGMIQFIGLSIGLIAVGSRACLIVYRKKRTEERMIKVPAKTLIILITLIMLITPVTFAMLGKLRRAMERAAKCGIYALGVVFLWMAAGCSKKVVYNANDMLANMATAKVAASVVNNVNDANSASSSNSTNGTNNAKPPPSSTVLSPSSLSPSSPSSPCLPLSASCRAKSQIFTICPGYRLGKLRGKVVALTFDDGPSPYTLPILRILAEEKIPATFFVIGQNVEKYPGIVRKAYHAGHTIANHTYQHFNLAKMDGAAASDALINGSKLIYRYIEQYPRFFRSPYGSCNVDSRQAARDLGLVSVNWAAIADDYHIQRTTPERIADEILALVRPGAIITLHDGGGDRHKTVEALRIIIQKMKLDGYRFVSLAKLIKQEPYYSAEQWNKLVARQQDRLEMQQIGAKQKGWDLLDAQNVQNAQNIRYTQDTQNVQSAQNALNIQNTQDAQNIQGVQDVSNGLGAQSVQSVQSVQSMQQTQDTQNEHGEQERPRLMHERILEMIDKIAGAMERDGERAKL